MLSLENRVGRLIEARVVHPLFDAEIDRYDIQRGKVIRALQAQYPRFVNCSDLRHVKILSSLHTKRFIEILRGNNPNLERAAFLISKKTLGLQFIGLQSRGNPFVYGGEERRAKREKEIDKLSIVCTVAAW